LLFDFFGQSTRDDGSDQRFTRFLFYEWKQFERVTHAVVPVREFVRSHQNFRAGVKRFLLSLGLFGDFALNRPLFKLVKESAVGLDVL